MVFTTRPPTEENPNTYCWTVSAIQPVQYDIRLCSGLLESKNPNLLEYGDRKPGSRRLVLIDNGVFDSIGERLEQYFRDNNIFCEACSCRNI